MGLALRLLAADALTGLERTGGALASRRGAHAEHVHTVLDPGCLGAGADRRLTLALATSARARGRAGGVRPTGGTLATTHGAGRIALGNAKLVSSAAARGSDASNTTGLVLVLGSSHDATSTRISFRVKRVHCDEAILFDRLTWYRRGMYSKSILRSYGSAGDATMPPPPSNTGLVLGTVLLATVGGLLWFTVNQKHAR